MIEFDQLIEENLVALRAGKAIPVQLGNWYGLIANAAWDAVLEPSSKLALENLHIATKPVLFFGDERQLLQCVSAYDLDDTEKLEAGKWLELDGLLGIAEEWLGARQSAQVAMVQDQLLFTLIRRLRTPLVGFSLVHSIPSN
ncbi:hypothetical protein [Flavihumibacter sp. UBA7668]|uniref:hypothetical protein n=1 Tax=Flavihumibacter sp. UBA7668 TaxID=1946542 RepID=UPI0025C07E82|nr:hypothetical protein [Flavihumibacter sp. UBA7668]